MKELVFDKDMLNEVRDVFLFGCYTGLSYLELFNLSAKDIVKGFDEKLWINTNRQKSSNKEAVPLLHPALKLNLSHNFYTNKYFLARPLMKKKRLVNMKKKTKKQPELLKRKCPLPLTKNKRT
ncbi:hypothetical protein QJ048_16695 [Pinibacter sp. MAH-24]|uniref:Uncharacterized protein n=2 Tax=Pinibacter soli TaxID=3044211 RepID=A0ABT6RGD6_9BACT|nr:hypothetical protein [Pinibacter soli]